MASPAVAVGGSPGEDRATQAAAQSGEPAHAAPHADGLDDAEAEGQGWGGGDRGAVRRDGLPAGRAGRPTCGPPSLGPRAGARVVRRACAPRDDAPGRPRRQARAPPGPGPGGRDLRRDRGRALGRRRSWSRHPAVRRWPSAIPSRWPARRRGSRTGGCRWPRGVNRPQVDAGGVRVIAQAAQCPGQVDGIGAVGDADPAGERDAWAEGSVQVAEPRLSFAVGLPHPKRASHAKARPWAPGRLPWWARAQEPSKARRRGRGGAPGSGRPSPAPAVVPS